MDLDVVGEIADAASDPGLGRGIAYDEWDARQHVLSKGLVHGLSTRTDR
ncbi:MAG: hypothetical protein R3E53_21780 [Myxococcota bacterium]